MKLMRLGFGIILLSLIVACTPPAEEIEGVASFPIEVTDHLGRVVKLEKIPEKIVSLSPSNTEILFALGLADKVVAVTNLCNYPEAALDKPKVGGFSTVDIERVVAVEPDLILAAYIHEAEVVPALERLGLTVLNLNPKTLDEVLKTIALVGKCTGKEEKAFQLGSEMRSRIKAVTDKTANLTEAQRPRVFYVSRSEPLYSVGSDALVHELLVSAGGINVFQHLSGTITVSLEAVIQANPQVMIAGTQMAGANLNNPIFTPRKTCGSRSFLFSLLLFPFNLLVYSIASASHSPSVFFERRLLL